MGLVESVVASVGQDLCKARQRRGKELFDVWRVLKIRPEYLSALEDGRFEDLPDRVYAIGYVRSYAAYLGLKAEDFVDRFKAEIAERYAPEPPVDPLPQPEHKSPEPIDLSAHRERKLPEPAAVLLLEPTLKLREPVIELVPQPEPRLPKPAKDRLRQPARKLSQAVIEVLSRHERKFAQGGLAIVGLLFAALIYSSYYAFSTAGQQAVGPVPPRLVAAAGLMQAPVPVPPPAIIEQPAPVAAEPPRETVEQTVPVVQQTVRGSPPAPPLPAPIEVAPVPVVAVPAEPARIIQASLPKGRRYGLHNKDSRITLRVHRPTYIAVQGVRNRKFLDRALFPGDTYRVPNLVGLKLTTQDAGAVELILDGSSVGFAGGNGVRTRDLSLNPQNIVDRQQPG